MKEIKLTQGKVAFVDDADFDYLNQFKWCLFSQKKGYAIRRDGKTNKFMHRELMGDLNGFEVDHIDRNTLNNTRKNLRHATHSENMQNRRTHGVAKYHGVTPHLIEHKYKYYRVSICKDHKCIYLGNFKSEIEAALVYDAAARRLFGEHARVNFI